MYVQEIEQLLNLPFIDYNRDKQGWIDLSGYRDSSGGSPLNEAHRKGPGNPGAIIYFILF